jgi:hypothetical protein
MIIARVVVGRVRHSLKENGISYHEDETLDSF